MPAEWDSVPDSRHSNSLLMGIHMFGRVLKYAGLGLLVLGVGYVAGQAIGGWIADSRYNDYRSQRAEETAQILLLMGTVQEGDALIDCTLLNRNGQEKLLSSLIKGRTLVTVFDHECPSCVGQLQEIALAVQNGLTADAVVLISTDNPATLAASQETLGVCVPLLHDRNRQFVDRLGIITYPFSIVVDDAMTIQALVAGGIRQDEIIELLIDR